MRQDDSVVPGYRSFGGCDSETAAVANILSHCSLTAPHTGAPFTEDLLFGIGGGISAGYMMFQICGGVVMWLGTRGAGHTPSANLVEGIALRLGVDVERKEAGGVRAADANLRAGLDGGRPVICWGDRALMPYNALPAELGGWFIHVFVVHGVTGGDALIGTRSRKGAVVKVSELAESRKRIGSLKNRTVLLEPPRRIGITAVRKAVREGIASCIRSCGPQSIKNYGLGSLDHVAAMARHPRDRKGWPRALSRPEDLFASMSALFQGIETNGTGGGGHRKMFSRFLLEAADILNKPRLEECARRYEALARRWKALASSCLPDEIEELGRARRLHVQAKKLFRRDAMKTLDERRELHGEIDALRARFVNRDPLPGDDRLAFFDSIARKLEKLRIEESDAIAELSAVVA